MAIRKMLTEIQDRASYCWVMFQFEKLKKDFPDFKEIQNIRFPKKYPTDISVYLRKKIRKIIKTFPFKIYHFTSRDTIYSEIREEYLRHLGIRRSLQERFDEVWERKVQC